ncbi:acetyl-CoA hydrolase [Mycolicibacterium flavescens]|uniref:Acetyl-CoA hydrolase n=1 Tax=Mycolicibacterium flavescens TaxID=1776 RepID=A0A1E3RHG4_MYCFV|nr:acetyl-CoA hydrolase/transferase C-terminal domain-containing protein [Mycolicibacterium flavescens]MCV7280226.1 acetyl-CoA hydrolase [Mycolicibacterium flavescens]ODQ89316.1 acetyl-CoA hydrolase [Mycolicibacterium flavescens]
MTVALGDGVGALRSADDGTSVCAAISALAAELGDIRLIVGWLTAPLDGLTPEAFNEVVALMPGWGVRDILTASNARFVPVRLSAIPALLRDTLRPDVLVTRLVEDHGQYFFATEVSWQRELVEAGVPVLGIVGDGPGADAGPPLPGVQVIGRCGDAPLATAARAAEPVHEALAAAVLEFVPQDARLQYGPGQLGTALLDRIRQPVAVDTGLLTDAVIGLERRGLLAETPSATYLLGTEELYAWADGRPILRGIDYTHNLTRLSRGAPLIAVNTAIEIDPFGQVNVEGVGDKIVGGIGGHPDYCAAAAMSRGGLSIIAVPSSVNGRSPYVERLSRPASTPAHDVDLIVTEKGHADLRGADWDQRRRLIAALFE